MKRTISLILTLLLIISLLPAGLIVNAETVTNSPFYMVNFAGIDSEIEAMLTYIYDMPYTWSDQGAITPQTKEAKVSFTGYDTSDYKVAAQKMKAEFDAKPAGTRYLNYMAMTGILFGSVKDVVDMEQGVALSKAWLEQFLAEYKSIGGKLDGIVVDLEYISAYTYYIGTEQYNRGNKAIYKQISENAVYQKRIRPKLVERGFVFYDNPSYQDRSELWTIHLDNSVGGNSTSRSIWDQTIQELLATYINEAAYEPMCKYYPDAVFSDYVTGDYDVWQKGMDHMGGQAAYTSVKVGNTSNANAYDDEPGQVFFGFSSEKNRTNRTKYQKPASHNAAVYADKPFSRLQWSVNDHKRMFASTDTGKINTWVTFYNYGISGTGYSRTPYYTELFYHLGMLDPEPFLGYIISSEVLNKGYDDPDPNICEYDYNLKIVDDILKELTRVAGASDRKAIQTPAVWNDGFLLSGMYAGGRNIWRVTPDTDVVSLKDFKVKDKAPTFRAGDVTITFPQGRIITDGSVQAAGSCGYWIETPANVTPVITSNADRYANTPSFAETFDYATGAFTAESVKPDTYWSVSGSATIVNNGGNKAVALSGDAAITNTKIPQLITAGDYYAKQQAWSVSVSVDSAYGDVVLLAAGDGGIKLSGGKVYYDKSGTYQELSGVSLAAGTYTVKRELDFRKEGAYTCTYSIFDAKGNRLGVAENVPVAIASLPVTQIKMSVSGASNAVKLDDYKLYPTGLSTSLDIYDVRIGRQISDNTTIRTEDTGYRLSWMNATNQYKVARVYEVKSGTILKKVEMAPGMDGVITGVASANGKSIQIAVDIQDAAAPTQPDYDNGKFGWTAASESLGLATGPKPAGSENEEPDPVPEKPGGDTTDPDNGAGEEGGNIYEDGIVEGTPENQPAATQPAGDGAAEATQPAASQPSEVQQAGGNSKILLIVIVAVVALVGGGAAVYFLVIKPKKTAKTPENSEE